MIKLKNKSNITTQHNHRGFTLAETLITLVIVGVVAALTVPTLVTKYQKEQTVTRLKKAYSTLAQTTNKAISEHGPIKTWEVSDSDTKSQEFLEKYMIPYLNVGKICGYKKTDECSYKYSQLNNPNTKYEFTDTYYKFFLADGTLIIAMAGGAPRGLTQMSASGQILGSYSFYGVDSYIYVDINGMKGPNRLGRDLFLYQYYIQWDMGPYGDLSGQFIPFGFSIENGHNANYYRKQGCRKDKNGIYCAAMIMADSWRISEKYPW